MHDTSVPASQIAVYNYYKYDRYMTVMDNAPIVISLEAHQYAYGVWQNAYLLGVTAGSMYVSKSYKVNYHRKWTNCTDTLYDHHSYLGQILDYMSDKSQQPSSIKGMLKF